MGDSASNNDCSSTEAVKDLQIGTKRQQNSTPAGLRHRNLGK